MVPSLSPPLSVAGTDLEASLLSFEKLDRASPDLWPEQRKFGGPAAVCQRGAGGARPARPGLSSGSCGGRAALGPQGPVGGCCCRQCSLPAALPCLFPVPGVAEFAASFKSVSERRFAFRVPPSPPLPCGGRFGVSSCGLYIFVLRNVSRW